VTVFRVLAISVAVAMCVGAIVTAIIIVTTDPGHGGTLAEVVQVCLLVSLPISIPLGLLGGGVAAWATRGPKTRPFSAWVRLGSVAGLLIGSLGAAAAALSFSTVSLTWKLYFVVGSVAGAMCGAAVGLWVSWYQREH
jgi:hypothetical protein